MYPSNGHPFDEGANLSARYRTGETLVGLRANGNWGGEGDRVGADVSAQRIFETRYVASVRTGVWQWDDKLRPDRDATSFNYVLGLGYRFLPRSQALVECCLLYTSPLALGAEYLRHAARFELLYDAVALLAVGHGREAFGLSLGCHPRRRRVKDSAMKAR